MNASVYLYSEKKGELNKFLSYFYNTNLDINKNLKWKKEYKNPIELAEIIGVFIDNINKYSITMWVSLDNDVYIDITDDNADKIIKYLYERFPY